MKYNPVAAASLVVLSLVLCLSGCQSEMAGGKMNGSADPKMAGGKMETEMMSDGKMSDSSMSQGKMSGEMMSDGKMADEKSDKR